MNKENILQDSLEDALAVSCESCELSLEAWCDGSYSIYTDTYSYGLVLIEPDGDITTISQRFSDEYKTLRNVAGEVMGAMKAINLCVSWGYKELDLYYDYRGIEDWATGAWKAKKELTRTYKRLVDKHTKDGLIIRFHKVLAHSGEHFNEIADMLANSAKHEETYKMNGFIVKQPDYTRYEHLSTNMRDLQ